MGASNGVKERERPNLHKDHIQFIRKNLKINKIKSTKKKRSERDDVDDVWLVARGTVG